MIIAEVGFGPWDLYIVLLKKRIIGPGTREKVVSQTCAKVDAASRRVRRTRNKARGETPRLLSRSMSSYI
jgi:hypothetical protein